MEQSPVLHYLTMLLFYVTGQMCLVTCTAYLAMKSTLPNGVWSITHYFAQRWPPLALRWFVSICLFMLVWNNPNVINLEKFLNSVPAHAGAAGLLGWVSDSVLDKVLAIIFPGLGISGKLPPVE